MNMDLVIGLIIATLVFIIFIQHEHAKSLDLTITQYEQQIEKLHQDSIQATKRADEAKANAQVQINSVISRNQKIMKSKVPHDCEKAMQWGIEQAARI